MSDFNLSAETQNIVDNSGLGMTVIEDMSEVTEDRGILPPARNVPFFIRGIKDNAEKDGVPRQWKFLGLELYLEDGIEIDGEVKYKNKVMWHNICYYADPAKYDFDKPYFAKRQYLIGLKQLATALGLELSGLTPQKVIDAGVNQKVLADIVVQAETVKDPVTGVRTPTGAQVNEIKNFKAFKDDFA